MLLSYKFFSFFVNCLMKNGKKDKYNKILLEVFLKIKIITGKSPYFILNQAILNVKPLAKTKPQVKSGQVRHIPVLFKPGYDIKFAIKSIIKNAVVRSEQSLVDKLVGEILDAVKKKSASYKDKLELHELVLTSRGNLYLRKKQKKRKKK